MSDFKRVDRHVDLERYYDLSTDKGAADAHLARCAACRAGLEAVHARLQDMPCSEFVELVTDYLEGAVDAALLARMEDHLRLCEGCRSYLDEVRETIGLMGRIPVEPPLSDAMRAALLAMVREVRAAGD